MIVSLALWIALVLSLAVITASVGALVRNSLLRLFVVLAFWAFTIGNFFAMQQPLGYPDHDRLPAGEWRVLGARIDVDVAIFAMLDNGDGEPRLFRLPYSAGEADKLQQALDNTAGGLASGVTIRADDQGEPAVHEEPVRGEAPKQAERPMFQEAT